MSRRKIAGVVLFSLFLILPFANESIAQNKTNTASSKTSATMGSYNWGVPSVPPNYAGSEISLLYSSSRNLTLLQKNEYETKKNAENRIGRYIDNELEKGRIYAVRPTDEFVSSFYDAEEEILYMRLAFQKELHIKRAGENQYSINPYNEWFLTERGSISKEYKVISFQFILPPERARDLKNDLRPLIILVPLGAAPPVNVQESFKAAMGVLRATQKPTRENWQDMKLAEAAFAPDHKYEMILDAHIMDIKFFDIRTGQIHFDIKDRSLANPYADMDVKRQAAEDVYDRITRQGVLRAGFSAGDRYHEDILKYIAKKMGVRFEYQIVDLQDGMNYDAVVDVYAQVPANPKMNQRFDTSELCLPPTSPIFIVQGKTLKESKKASDFSGKRIGMMGSYRSSIDMHSKDRSLGKKFHPAYRDTEYPPNTTMIPFDSREQALNALWNNQIVALALKQEDIGTICCGRNKIFAIRFLSNPSCIGIRKNSPKLLQFINKTFEEMKVNGEFKKIFTRHVGPQANIPIAKMYWLRGDSTIDLGDELRCCRDGFSFGGSI